MKKNFFSTLLMLSFNSMILLTNSFAGTIINRPGIGDCELTFEDNFDSTALNTNKWGYRTDRKHWSVQQPSNVSVHDGCLYLNVKKRES